MLPMKKSNQTKQRLVQLLLVGLCLLNVAVYYVLVRPIIQADQIATSKAVEIQNKLMKRRLVHNKIAQIERLMLENTQHFNEFKNKTLFPQDKGTSELLKELEEVCEKAQLSKTRGTFQYDRQVRFGTRKLTIVLPIKGTYSKIRKLLYLLENQSKFIIVDSLSLEDSQEESGIVQIDLRLSTLIGNSS